MRYPFVDSYIYACRYVSAATISNDTVGWKCTGHQTWQKAPIPMVTVQYCRLRYCIGYISYYVSIISPVYIYIYLLFIYLFIIIYIYTVHIHVYMHILLIIYPYYIPILSPVYCIWQTPGMEQLLAPPILPSLAAVTTESMRCWNTQKHIICWYVLIWFFLFRSDPQNDQLN